MLNSIEIIEKICMEHVTRFFRRLYFFLHLPLCRVDSSPVISLDDLDCIYSVRVWDNTDHEALLLSLYSRLLPSLSRSMVVLSFDMTSFVIMP